MSILIEKRSGADRRRKAELPPSELGERRCAERRQIVVTDISFFQWATHFASFQRGLAMPEAGHSGSSRGGAGNNETDTNDGNKSEH